MSIEVKPTAQEIAVGIVGAIEWLSENEGLCECPGKAMHTSNNGKRDCKIYLDGAPTLACFHSSCKRLVEAKNAELRKALREGSMDEGSRVRMTLEEKRRMAEIQRKESVRKRAANSRVMILKQYCWPYQQIIKESPVGVTENISEHWRLLLAKFQSGDVVWIGDKFDSGKPEHADHFKTAEQWSVESSAPGPFVCPVVFKNSSVSRSNDNVVARRFLVIESDTLTRDEVGAVFKWLRDVVKLPLVAIVDTAGKSLHGWFEYPPEHIIDELKLVLPELGCDPALFKASQPVRLPGAMRGDKPQKLVYLAKEVAR
jgi:hypothetical protein